MDVFHFFKGKKKKESKPTQTSFLMFKVKHVNSITTFASFFIRLSKKVTISSSSLNFKIMEISKFNALVRNQWPLNWLNTQTNTIVDKQ